MTCKECERCEVCEALVHLLNFPDGQPMFYDWEPGTNHAGGVGVETWTAHTPARCRSLRDTAGSRP